MTGAAAAHTTTAASAPKPKAQQREPAIGGDELLGLRFDRTGAVVGHPHRHGGCQDRPQPGPAVHPSRHGDRDGGEHRDRPAGSPRTRLGGDVEVYVGSVGDRQPPPQRLGSAVSGEIGASDPVSEEGPAPAAGSDRLLAAVAGRAGSVAPEDEPPGRLIGGLLRPGREAGATARRAGWSPARLALGKLTDRARYWAPRPGSLAPLAHIPILSGSPADSRAWPRFAQPATALGPSSALRSAIRAVRGRDPQRPEPQQRGPRAVDQLAGAPRPSRDGWPAPPCSRSTSGGVHRDGGRASTTGFTSSGALMSGMDRSIAIRRGWSSRRSTRPAHDHDRVLGDVLPDQLVRVREEQHLDRAVEVLQRGRGPRPALLGDPPLHAGEDAGQVDDLAVGDRALLAAAAAIVMSAAA